MEYEIEEKFDVIESNILELKENIKDLEEYIDGVSDEVSDKDCNFLELRIDKAATIDELKECMKEICQKLDGR